jgi:hypothetical protein
LKTLLLKGTITTTANFSIKTAKQWLLVVIPGLTRNPERIENHGFPITNFGNDKKYAVVLIKND